MTFTFESSMQHWNAIQRIHSRYSKEVNDVLKPKGLSKSQFDLLMTFIIKRVRRKNHLNARSNSQAVPFRKRSRSCSPNTLSSENESTGKNGFS